MTEVSGLETATGNDQGEDGTPNQRRRRQATQRSSPAQSILRTDRICKSFGATRALLDCTIEVRPGEVHAIVGENGSGKSTLVKILAGVHRPDAGRLVWEGVSMTGLRGPRAAHAVGLFTVFQEVLVVSSRSVLSNVWLGFD